MPDKDICKQCPQHDKCGHVYGRMGKFRGPSVLLKVIAAFLLPLLIFIASLAVLEQILANLIESKGLRILVSFAGAGCLTMIYALLAAALSRRARQKEKK